MLPEISRRCLGCGASVRASARYCPQCGSGLFEKSGGAATEADARGAVSELAKTRAAAEKLEGADVPLRPDLAATRDAKPSPTNAEPAPPSNESRGEAAAAKVAGAVGATRRRAASVVKESIAPHVERVRDRSIVMLEEAPDDSGLRFVIIAAVLFALFIFLLVLSTVIK